MAHSAKAVVNLISHFNAVRRQSQVLRFKSATQMLETFGMQKGGAKGAYVARDRE